MPKPRVTFACLRQFLIYLGFNQVVVPKSHVRFYHDESGTDIIVPIYRSSRIVMLHHLITARIMLDAKGFMDGDIFDDVVAAASTKLSASRERFDTESASRRVQYRGGLTMVKMTLEIPEEALAALRKGPDEFARELRLAAAVKWYELKLLSQERAARVAGLSRTEFLDALGRFHVSPFQYGADEILKEAGV